VRAAVVRRTTTGQPLGLEERLRAGEALALYLDDPAAPGRQPRRVAVGEAADLCLLKAPPREVLAEPSAELVAATISAGRPIFTAP
jgi:predicted amidohydrolase YtcJ